MKRPGPLRSNPATVAEWRRRTARPLPPQSDKRAGESEARRIVRLAVIARDRVCLLGPLLGEDRCSGDLTFHHLRKRSQGGGWTLDNGVALCAKMNAWVEDFPLEAWRMGLVCRRGESLEACWERMRITGLLSYDPNGVAIAPLGPPT